MDRFYNGKAGRAERSLEISTIAVVDAEASMAYALSVRRQTPSNDSTAAAEAESLTRVDHYLAPIQLYEAYRARFQIEFILERPNSLRGSLIVRHVVNKSWTAISMLL